MQQISLITLGITDVARSQRFYAEGFGWQPVFSNGEITFYQMNGLVLGTWLAPLIEALVAAGGTLLKPPAAPPHGGYAGHVADPDGHVWEIAWNPAWHIDAEGRVTFGV